MSTELFDVVAIRFDNGARRLIAERKTERNAEATVMMAVSRRGVEDEYFDVRPHPASLVSHRRRANEHAPPRWLLAT